MDSSAKNLVQNQEDISPVLVKLQNDYLEKLPKKINLIRDIWQKLTHLSWHDDAFGSLYRLIHGLAGSGKTFGCDQVSAEARILENFLSPLVEKYRVPTDKEHTHIESLINNIVVAATNSNSKHDIKMIPVPNISPKEKNREKIIFVVDDDSYISMYMSTLLSNIGYQVRTFAYPNLAIDYVKNCTPDAVIMDIMFPTEAMSGIEAVSELRTAIGKRVPILFISARADLSARARVVRAGGDAYFTKPLDFSVLAEKLDKLLENTTAGKVLIVDDDIELSQYHALLLNNKDMKTQIVNQPVDIIKYLEEFQPDLILMDLHMPNYNGLELATIIRQDEKFVGLPIIFLSSEDNADYHEQAFGLGANEFLMKPVAEDNLISTVDKQIRLSKQIRDRIKKISKIDPTIGLYNRQFFLEKLDYALATATDSHATKALYCIGVEKFEQLADKYGIQCLDSFSQQLATIIKAHMSINDMAAEFSDGLYMVLAGERDTQQISELAKSILNSISDSKIRIGNDCISLDCSIGISIINPHVSSLRELISSAEEACSEKMESGGNGFAIREILPLDKIKKNELLERIKHSLQEKTFQLVFQPIVSVEHRSYEMYEVLLRMRDSEGRIVLPSQFMPIAKESNDIIAIDRWVVEHAITSLAKDKHAKSATDFFIKLSGITLGEKMLIPSISNSLTEGAIVGDTRIIFHIHENDILEYTQDAVAFSNNVRKLKCGICIDHYGITDNSVNLVDIVKPTFVKLRESVLNNILECQKTQKKILSLVEYANTNNIKVIASNLEDPATLSVLWGMGIRYYQGFFIQAPDTTLDFNFSNSAL